MEKVIFITHPEVVVDPSVSVARWALSSRGVERMRAFVETEVVKPLGSVWASTEIKAIEAAGLLAARYGIGVNVHPGLSENDRSSTGFLPPEEFEAVADEFFSKPEESVRGWERAVDAQSRVRAAFDEIVASKAGETQGNAVLVSHGGVGTLLYCSLMGCGIERRFDQPYQGHYWTYDVARKRMLHPWVSIAE